MEHVGREKYWHGILKYYIGCVQHDNLIEMAAWKNGVWNRDTPGMDFVICLLMVRKPCRYCSDYAVDYERHKLDIDRRFFRVLAISTKFHTFLSPLFLLSPLSTSSPPPTLQFISS